MLGDPAGDPVGEGWALADPSSMTGGLQIRHALPDLEQTRQFMEAYHPGVDAWLVDQDLESGRRELGLLNATGHR